MKRDELRRIIFGNVVWRSLIARVRRAGKVFWNEAPVRVIAPFVPARDRDKFSFQRVELFGIAALSGW